MSQKNVQLVKLNLGYAFKRNLFRFIVCQEYSKRSVTCKKVKNIQLVSFLSSTSSLRGGNLNIKERQ